MSKEPYVTKDGAQRSGDATVSAKKLDPAQRIFDVMYEQAMKWEKLTGGGVFFELVTDDGGKIRCATKNSKRKV